MPKYFLSIGSDIFGNQICISLNDEEYGYIYWWDHENEWYDFYYFEETGKEMPEEVKYQNLHLIAHSFTEFLKNLQVIDEDDET